jgi:hypothetical protein
MLLLLVVNGLLVKRAGRFGRRFGQSGRPVMSTWAVLLHAHLSGTRR